MREKVENLVKDDEAEDRSSLSASIWREIGLVQAAGQGTLDSLREAASHPCDTGVKLAAGFALGSGLTLLARGRYAPGLASAIGVGMGIAAAKDIGLEASKVWGSASAAWNSDADLQRHKEVVGGAIGHTLVDGALFAAGGYAGIRSAPRIDKAADAFAAMCSDLVAPRMQLAYAFESGGAAAMESPSMLFAKRRPPVTKADVVLESPAPAETLLGDTAGSAKNSRKGKATETVEKEPALEETLAAKRKRVVKETVGAIDQFCRKHGAYDSFLTVEDMAQMRKGITQAISKPGGYYQWTPSIPEFKRITVQSPGRSRHLFPFKDDIAVVIANGTDSRDVALTAELNALINSMTKHQWYKDTRL